MLLYESVAQVCVAQTCISSRDSGKRKCIRPCLIHSVTRMPGGSMQSGRQSAMWLWEIPSLCIHWSRVDYVEPAEQGMTCTVSTGHFLVSLLMGVWRTS